MRELNLLYVHGEQIGYGRYGVHLAQELTAMGVEVYDRLPGTPDYLDRAGREKICDTACWVSVPTHARGWFEGQHPVISTMWEATRLPESLRENLHEFATVIVPSHQNVDLFSQYHHDVRLVPLGVDPGVWRFTERSAPTNQFRFLIGGSGPRKGTDLAFKAFRKLFGKPGSWNGPEPVLVMKNPRGEDFYGDRVEMIGGRISAEDEVALYESAHCYLQPSRGEGFGLQPLQAIAQGMPTILTGAHGHDSFAHLGYPISAGYSKAGYFIYGDAGEWWEPSLDELCDRMRWVYDHYAEAQDYARVSSQMALQEFTWRRTAERFVDALDGHTGPYTGSGEWRPCERKHYRLVTLRDYRADIAGGTFMFEKGREYWESADVKRILFEAGILDPVCVDDRDGLTPEQYERIPDYTAAHSRCPMCGQDREPACV